jgi:hypothetical protein
MKRIYKWLVLILLSAIIVGTTGCDEKETYTGTTWKLAGYVDSTGIVRELEPKDCEHCYTIFFDSETEAHGSDDGANALSFTFLPERIIKGGTKIGSTREDGVFFSNFWQERVFYRN